MMIKGLRRLTTFGRNHLNHPSLGKYHLEPEALDALYYNALSLLTEKETKPMAISSFHPGSSLMFAKLAQCLAESLKASYLEIDLAKCVSVESPSQVTDVNALAKTKFFEPSQYQMPVIEESEEESDENMFDLSALSLNDLLIDVTKQGSTDTYRMQVKTKDDPSMDLGALVSKPISRLTLFGFPASIDVDIKTGSSPTLVHIRDTADIIEAGSQNGLRALSEVVAQVSKLRDQGHQIILMFSIQPPITNIKNLQKTPEFYQSLLTDSLQDTRTGQLVDLKKSKKLHRSHFDAWRDKAVIVEMSHSIEKPLDDVWKTLKSDLEKRVVELNLVCLGLECARRGYKLEEMDMKSLEASSSSWALASSHVWSLLIARRVVQLMIGYQSELSGQDFSNISQEPLMKSLALLHKIESDGFKGSKVESKNLSSLRKMIKEPKKSSILDILNKNGPLTSHEKKLVGTVVDPDQVKTGFHQVILPPTTKSILQTLVTLPILRPDLFAQGVLANYSINGVLLFGPPGTGKTLLAKAAAKSCGAHFMGVSLSDLFDKYVGEGEKNVKAMFSLARKLSPCIIFLDEVDAIFGARASEGSFASRRELINEFMAEWDGLVSNNRGIVVVGATNRPFDLDDAILRRMPRRVLIDLPDLQSRKQILESHLRSEVLDDSVSTDALAVKTELYSGSDLKNLLVSAALSRAKEEFIHSSDPTLFLDREQLAIKFSELAETPPPSLSHREDPSLTRTIEKMTPLSSRHFDIAFLEVPPSLSQEASSLVELRKWNAKFGENSSRTKTPLWGFA